MEDLQLLVSLIEGTNDLIHSVTPDGSFEFVNRAWLERMEYDSDEIDQLGLKDILFPGEMKKHQEVVSQILNGMSRTDVQTTFITKHGDAVHVEGNLFPRKEGNSIVAATGFFRDTTERKRAAKELKESRARIEFLADLMVHDLTNINQEILSTLEVLLYNPSLPRQLEGFIREGLDEIDRASKLISGVRKITRLDALPPVKKEWELTETVAKAAESVSKSFEDKELDLETNVEAGEYYIIADQYLDDVFYSLFHNSMKFDKSDRVKIIVDAEEVTHTPFLRVEVKDFGPGISDHDKERVFSELSHRRESILGLGLGLTLVKKILENNGGFIRVEDRVANDHTKGANFVMLLRYKRSEQAEEG